MTPSTPSPTRAVLFLTFTLAACGQKADLSTSPDPAHPTDGVDASPDAESSDVASPDAASPDAPADGLPRVVDMFDDFEDGNLDVNPAGGRFGHWYNYGDGTEGTNAIGVVTLDPATERHETYRQTSKMALRVRASGYTNWGSGYSADIAASSPYDISAYTGLVFWTKSLSATPVTIRVSISDVNSDPRGGRCDKTTGAPKETACYDTFGKVVTLFPGEWSIHVLPFWSLEQQGFGITADALASHQAYSVVIADYMGIAYDYEIDDIGFYIE